MNKIRFFIAVDMPEPVIQESIKIQELLKRKNLFKGRYTAPEGIHATLKFLGDVQEDTIPSINKALQSIVMSPMDAQLGSLDVFSRGKHIKIIFVQIVCPQLVTLAKKIDIVLADFFEPEQRAFVIHITLARVKMVKDRQKLLDELQKVDVDPLRFTITEFVLKQSVLSPEGPLYTDVARYSLR